MHQAFQYHLEIPWFLVNQLVLRVLVIHGDQEVQARQVVQLDPSNPYHLSFRTRRAFLLLQLFQLALEVQLPRANLQIRRFLVHL